MRLYQVKGKSMYPFIRDDDFVIVKQVSFRRLKPGNILVFQGADGEYLVHRLIRKDRKGLIYLRGDGYNLPTEAVEKSVITGRAVGIVRSGRQIRFSRVHELYYWILSRLKENLKNLIRGRAGLWVGR